MKADRSHTHHKLIDMGMNQKQAVATLYLVAGLVPKTLMIRSFSTLFLLFRRGVRGRFCQSFLMLVVVVGVAGNAGHGIGRANQRR